jgi:hypothetical protein
LPLCDFSYLITSSNGAAAKANMTIDKDKELIPGKENFFSM